MTNFHNYAQYYDLIYQDKAYKKEVTFLKKAFKQYSTKTIKSILSLGCGTASHEMLLAKEGYKITGVDRSEEMLNKARQKAKQANVNITFTQQDICQMNLVKKFDAVIAMFNVMGYLTTNDQVVQTLSAINKHLKKGGLFIADLWYGPAVLKNPPVDRVKVIKKRKRKIIRLTTQEIDINKQIINIWFNILEIGKEKVITEFKENHPIRFFYLLELSYFLKNNNLELVAVCPFLNLKQQPSSPSWNISVIAKKI